MPAKFHVSLIPENPIHLREVTPDRLHALFFSLLSEDLAQEVHSQSRVKPFSLNFLVGFEGKKQPLFATDFETADRIILEVSFLDESLFPKFLSSYMLTDKELKLGQTKLRKLKRPHIRERELVSYKRLFEEAKPNKRIELRFMSPTSFRRGKLDHPLPEPELIFKGLIRKWQRFSDIKIDVDLREVIRERIAVAGAWIGTKRVNLSGFGWIGGFTGRVALSLEEKEEKVLKWLNALARFSEFAGVGRKTTMGFGAVRLEDKKVSEEPDPTNKVEIESSASDNVAQS